MARSPWVSKKGEWLSRENPQDLGNFFLECDDRIRQQMRTRRGAEVADLTDPSHGLEGASLAMPSARLVKS